MENIVERMIHLATIRNLEDSLSSACEINAELRQSVNRLGIENDELKREVIERIDQNTENKKRIRRMDLDIASLENAIDIHESVSEKREFKMEGIIRSRNFWKGYARKEIKRTYRLRRIIQLLKSRMSRLEKKIEVMKNVANEWQNLAYFYKREMFAREAEIFSLKAQLENARKEIATTDEIPVSEICEVPFDENVNYIIGYAPCGNGCEMKRTISGRLIDVHDITCEENPEYAGIWLD